MGMNDFTPGYTDAYLAHSKGPWKKHKYIRKVGNRYYYNGSKRYNQAMADQYDEAASKLRPGSSEQRAAKNQAYAYKRKVRAANSKATARKNRYKHYGIVAKNTVTGAAGTVAKKARDAKYLTSAKVSVAKFKATQGAKRLKRKASASASKLAGRAKFAASQGAQKMSAASARVARKAKFAASQGAQKMSATSARVARKVKGKARYAKATASAYGIKAKRKGRKLYRSARTSVSAATRSGKAAINRIIRKGVNAGKQIKYRVKNRKRSKAKK